MNKTISIIAGLGLLLSNQVIQAQDSGKILDQLSAKAKGYSTISADYTSRLQDVKADLDLTQEGNIKVKDKKYNLDLPSYTVISDGTTVWTYEKENNAVYIDNLEDVQEDGINPNDLFRIWETGFKHEYKETKSEGGAELYWINLYPNDPGNKPYHTIQLYIDKAKMEINKIKVMNRDGSTVTYTVKGFAPNKTLEDSKFRFNPASYPGVEVIDNRI